MKNDKNFSAKCYAVAALLFYICAGINFFSHNSSLGVTYLCLGTTFICLTANENNKNKESGKNSEDGNDEKPSEEDKKDEENK